MLAIDAAEVRTGRKPSLRAAIVLAAVAAISPVAAGPAERVEALQISSDLRVRVHRGRDIALDVLAEKADSYSSISERITGSGQQAEAISSWNGGEDLSPGSWVGVPLSLVSGEYRGLVLRTLFPEDSYDGSDLIHIARSGGLPTYDEGLWQLAEWYTGRGAAFEELMRENGLSSPELRAGQRIRIAERLLHPALKAGRRSDDGSLEYGSDPEGPFAGYRLRSGEALYSAVVGRFTGRTIADDVIAVAETIRQRSGIKDLRDIPVGYLVKIPLELLEPQFLPQQHPRRREAEAAREQIAQALASRPVGKTGSGLQGVVVILDPGHGGEDLGTMNNGIWEHDYVYDVTCRLKRKLETESSATVHMTLVDEQTGCEPSKGDELEANRQGTIKTTPPFLPRKGESKMSVNLRWYLANSIFRTAIERGTDRDRIVFISLHADSRHPSLRGVMVYVPGASYRTETYGFSSSTYKKYEEVREKPHIKFSKDDRIRSEAVSLKYADSVIRAFKQAGLPIQPYQPVRNRIIRGKSAWVPAVLRGNAIPNKILVEMVNMKNRDDAALLAAAARRELLAEALFESLKLHFDDKP